ncbi:hypothetical protein FRC17_006078 [Serendipita sp. 399]|nr:hypothetical protein FRC17_006078 [Serendipita sp. 399]
MDTDLSQLNLDEDYQPSVSSNAPPRRVVSKLEAMFYYAGISPTPPKLVYRTGKRPWVKPTGPEAYRQLKQLRPVFGHKLNDVSKEVGPKIHGILDSHSVSWISIDVVRFLKGGDREVVGPIVLWIGVLPNSLQAEDAFHSAKDLFDLLACFDITDV